MRTMRDTSGPWTHLLLLAILAPAPDLWAAAAPATVSPGAPDRYQTAPDRCPTFSWGSIDGAERYELVVVQDVEDAPLSVLERVLPGSVTSWTPSLESCLGFGQRYGWAVRAADTEGAGEWSEVRLFQTPGQPTQAEVAAALEVLRAWTTASETGDTQQLAQSTTLAPTVELEADPLAPSASGPTSKASIGSSSVAMMALESTTLGNTAGVKGSVASTGYSAGVIAEATATSGDAVGLYASAASPTAPSAILKSLGGGPILSGRSGSTEVISVDTTGALTATKISTVNGSGLQNLNGSNIASGTVAEARIDSAIARDSEVLGIVQAADGAGSGLDADLLDGLHASAFAGSSHNHSGGPINSNTQIGLLALSSNSIGSLNTGVGYRALQYNTTGANSTALGARAMWFGTGSNNTAVGTDALRVASGGGNVGIGEDALTANTSGSGNVGVGQDALAANTYATGNTAVGNQALYSADQGGDNVALGAQALYSATNADANVAVGFQALHGATTSSRNIAIGPEALTSGTIGTRNVALGDRAMADLADNSAIYHNVAIGHEALGNSTASQHGIAIGSSAMRQNASSYPNIGIGASTLQINEGYQNTAVGHQALAANTYGHANSALGYQALAGNNIGYGNTAVGNKALTANTQGFYNTALGGQALQANTTGVQNVGLGQGALASNTVGYNNTAVGKGALSANITGNNNIALGVGAGSATTGSGNILIGHPGVAAEDNTIRIGSGKTTVVGGPLIVGVDSLTVTDLSTGAHPSPYPVDGILGVSGDQIVRVLPGTSTAGGAAGLGTSLIGGCPVNVAPNCHIVPPGGICREHDPSDPAACFLNDYVYYLKLAW